MTTIKATDNRSLTGQLLIAVPGIDDIRFNRSVVYIFSHDEAEGARGLVINKPAEKLFLRDILSQLKITESSVDLPLLLGGPDKLTSGFILHSPDYRVPATHPIDEEISLTATQDILTDIAAGKGPKEYLMALGCSTWTRGQLEDELSGNVWLTAPATKELLFHTPFEDRWHLALKNIGIESYRLSALAGKA